MTVTATGYPTRKIGYSLEELEEAGVKGPKGDEGPRGPQGPAGQDGARGPKGDTGEKGLKGDEGSRGPEGPAGADGKDGARGPKGDTGEKGLKGDEGPAGQDGARGPKGDTGEDNSTSARLAYGPGPQELLKGNMEAGYFGEVSAQELYSGERLSLELGVTEGTLQNSEVGWLKFAHKGKVKFVAKQTFQHSISWDHLYSRGLVYGTNNEGKAPRGDAVNQFTTVERGGNEFVVRLLTGANADPFDGSDPKYRNWEMKDLDMGGGSEWNELIYRVHQDIPDASLPAEEPADSSDGSDGQRLDRHGGPQQGDNWETFTDGQIGIASGVGRSTWCQEQSEQKTSSRVRRGPGGVAHFSRLTGSGTGSSGGWRPCLELIPNN